MAEVTAAGIMAVTTEDIINQLKAHNNINGQHYGIPYCCPFYAHKQSQKVFRVCAMLA